MLSLREVMQVQCMLVIFRDQRQNNRDRHGSSRKFGKRNDHISNLNVRDNHQETRDLPRARENERFRLRRIPCDFNRFDTALRIPASHSVRTGTTNDDARNGYNRNNRSSRHKTSTITVN